MKKSLVLLDFDGTLFNTSEGIIESTKIAFARMGFPVPNEKEFCHEIIGPPLEWTYTEVLHLSETEADKTIACFREYYANEGVYLSFPYQNIDKMLQKLTDAGIYVAIASSKPSVFIQKLLEKYNLTKYFTVVSGITIGGDHLTKGDVIRIAMEQFKVSSENTVMVGDRKYDMLGAIENNITPVGVTYGFGSREELLQSGAKFLADSADELCNILFEILV